MECCGSGGGGITQPVSTDAAPKERMVISGAVNVKEGHEPVA